MQNQKHETVFYSHNISAQVSA